MKIPVYLIHSLCAWASASFLHNCHMVKTLLYLHLYFKLREEKGFLLVSHFNSYLIPRIRFVSENKV